MKKILTVLEKLVALSETEIRSLLEFKQIPDRFAEVLNNKEFVAALKEAEFFSSVIKEQANLLRTATRFDLPRSISLQKRENNMWVILTRDYYIWNETNKKWLRDHQLSEPSNEREEGFMKNTRYPLHQALTIAKTL